ncbi:MAG: hypothetical protein HZB50_07050 [Chloroflexi bacterium]|nr:hypothetical protein [Chloroflexota bacterium]
MKKDGILLSLLQALCVLAGYLWVRIFFMEADVLPTPWWLLYFIPHFVSLIASFLLSLFLITKFKLKNVAWISAPATLVYFICYAVIPLVSQYDSFYFVAICGFVLPLAFVGFLMNSFGIWAGSYVRSKVFKTETSA